MKFKFSNSQKKGILHFSSSIMYHKALEEKFKTACHESKKIHFSPDVNMSLRSPRFTQPIEQPILTSPIPSFDYHRRVDHSPPSLSFSQDDRFSPRTWRIVARLKAVGSIRAKGNVAYNGEKAFPGAEKRLFHVKCIRCFF